MNRRWTILATCLLALAIAMVAGRHDKPPEKGSAAGSPPRPVGKPELNSRTASVADRVKTHATPHETHRDDARVFDGQSRSTSRGALAKRPAADNLSRSELERRAQLVEQAANHELDRLIPLLDLNPAQQDRVFQALASSSPNFVAGMQVGGAALKPTTGNSQQALLAELSDTQVTAYLQDSNESSAWWSEYVSSVASQLDSGSPAIGGGTSIVTDVPTGPTTPAETAPATKDAHTISGDE